MSNSFLRFTAIIFSLYSTWLLCVLPCKGQIVREGPVTVKVQQQQQQRQQRRRQQQRQQRQQQRQQQQQQRQQQQQQRHHHQQQPVKVSSCARAASVQYDRKVELAGGGCRAKS